MRRDRDVIITGDGSDYGGWNSWGSSGGWGGKNGGGGVVVFHHRCFVVLGDQGPNAVVEPDYWENLAHAMSDRLKSGERCEALIHGVRT